MLALFQHVLRQGLLGLSRLASGWPDAMNPMRHLGALTIFFFWIVLISGIWIFIFFRTSVDGAYESVEYLTHHQWYLGGVMRSLHRYASDAAVITLVLHIAQEFAFDRHRGKRWFSWVTGVPLLWMIIPLGITGYWLVWDRLAQFVALASAELIDWLPIFTDAMARNFLSESALSDRFFTLMTFLHLIGLPLFLVFGIWLHVFRINQPRVNPPRLLMSGSLLAMLLLSLVFPAISQEQADLARATGTIGLDWFYLLIYPLIDSWDLGWVWALLLAVTLLLFVAPWLPPARTPPVAVVDLDNCNGCERCVADCPFGAVMMMPRSDGKAYEREAVVDPDLCLSCGICVGACPTATPFRRRSDLVPGIDLPGASMATLRERIVAAAEQLKGEHTIIVFACSDREVCGMADARTAVITVSCMAQLPPSFIDFILSRGHARGVLLAGCGGQACQYRLGKEWTTHRLQRTRDPRLRGRVDARQIAMAWEAPWSRYPNPAILLSAFRESLGKDVPIQAPPSCPRLAMIYRALAWLAFIGVIGVFSQWPPWSTIDDGEALVSLSFSHAGQRIEACRVRSQTELNELPPNMRQATSCPRERHAVRVNLALDGVTIYSEVIEPSGLWNDGESSFYERMRVPAGDHLVTISLADSADEHTPTYQAEWQLSLNEGQHRVIEFDRTAQEFRIQ